MTAVDDLYTGGEEPEVGDVIVPYNYATAANPSVVMRIDDNGWLRIAWHDNGKPRPGRYHPANWKLVRRGGA